PLSGQAPAGEAPAQVGHLERGERGVAAAVAAALAAAGERLLELVAGQDAEGDRHAARPPHSRQRDGGVAADMAVVGGAAADHGAEADDRVDLQVGDGEARREGELDRARHLDHGDVLLGDAVRAQRLERAVEEALRDQVVEAAADHGDLQAVAVAGGAMRAYHCNRGIFWGGPALARRGTIRAGAAAAALGAIALAIACGGDPPRAQGSAQDGGGPGRRARPNLIVVVVDTLRRDHLSLYG